MQSPASRCLYKHAILQLYEQSLACFSLAFCLKLLITNRSWVFAAPLNITWHTRMQISTWQIVCHSRGALLLFRDKDTLTHFCLVHENEKAALDFTWFSNGGQNSLWSILLKINESRLTKTPIICSLHTQWLLYKRCNANWVWK